MATLVCKALKETSDSKGLVCKVYRETKELLVFKDLWVYRVMSETLDYRGAKAFKALVSKALPACKEIKGLSGSKGLDYRVYREFLEVRAIKVLSAKLEPKVVKGLESKGHKASLDLKDLVCKDLKETKG